MAWTYEIGVAAYYTESEQENNALEFYNFFSAYGASVEAICGMLGNITKESTLNPGIKQSSSVKSGWGLIQWTPSTVLTDWCAQYGYNWYDGAAQCERIVAEGEKTLGASGYFLPTKGYPYTWEEFCKLSSVEEATAAYLYERERPKSPNLDARVEAALRWYTFLTGNSGGSGGSGGTPRPPDPPTPPTPGVPRRKGMPVYMMTRLL